MTRDLASIVGGRVTGVEPLRWGFRQQVDLVTLEDGRRLAVKRFDGPHGATEARRAAAVAPVLAAAGLSTPAVVASGWDDDPPWMVFEYVAGRPGVDRLDDADGVATLASIMGGLATRLRNVPVAPRADDPWADAGRLRATGMRWLGRVRAGLDPATSDAIERTVERITDPTAWRSPVFGHGDFVPVNVLIDPTDSNGYLLDLGEWRCAHPWLDVAWWGWVVRTYHEASWAAAWPAFRAAAGVPPDPDSTATIRDLQLVRALEWAATRKHPSAPRLLEATTHWDTAR